MNNLTQAGIIAYKIGDKTKAQLLFKQAAQENDQDIQAWLGLAATAPTSAARLDYFICVLQLDANNATAMKGLARMAVKDELVIRAKATDSPAAPGQQGERGTVERRSDEQVVFQVRPAMYLMILRAMGIFALVGLIAIYGFTGNGFLGSILTVASILLLVISFLAVLYAILTYRATQYTLTTQHLIVSDGLFNRSRRTIPIQRIQDVAFHQSLLERLLGIGVVSVESAGEFGKFKLRDLADSQKRANQILQLINRY